MYTCETFRNERPCIVIQLFNKISVIPNQQNFFWERILTPAILEKVVILYVPN